MIAVPQCPRCHRAIPDDAPHEACPSCLLQLALAETFEGEDTNQNQDPDPIFDDRACSQLLALTHDADALPHLPNYEVGEEVGRGGTGVVCKARQQGTERTVAVKFLLNGVGTASERQRFRAEVKALGQLDHPHIVKVFEFGEEEGCPYYSMEYLGGGTLGKKHPENQQTPAGQILRECYVDPRRAAELVKTLAEAIHVSHEAGLLHRDLKPSNILIASDGTPKIADFGLVKPWGQLADSQQLTRSMNLIGSPAYMAPEQAQARKEDIGPATDVYGLGCILFEITTGRIPFRAATATQTLDKVVRDPVEPPRLLNSRIPKNLEAICLKALAKLPSERYPTAAALAEDLDHFLKNEPIEAKPLTNRHRLLWKARHHLPRLIAVLFVVAAVGGAAIAIRPKPIPETASQKLQREIDSFQEVSLTDSKGKPLHIRWLTPEQILTINEDKSFTFLGINNSDLELLPSELVPPSYRLKMEVRVEAAKSAGCVASLYFGRHGIKATDGSGLETNYWLEIPFNPYFYQEHNKPEFVRLTTVAEAYVPSVEYNKPNSRTTIGHVPQTLLAKNTPNFTQFIIDVRPTGLEIWKVENGVKEAFVNSWQAWNGMFSTMNAECLMHSRNDVWKHAVKAARKNANNQIPLHPRESEWNGQGSLGIFLTDDTQASFRNISIQKLAD